MHTFPYTFPVEVIDRIISFCFDPAGRLDLSEAEEDSLVDPPPSDLKLALLLVSKAVRLITLPYFFEVVIIRRKQDWQTFFDPSTGIFVVGEEGARRWSWVKELAIPLRLPPSVNPVYKLGLPSYLLPLAIPDTKPLDFLRYLPLRPDGIKRLPHEGRDHRGTFLFRFAEGEVDPELLEDAQDATRRVYEDGPDDDEDPEDPGDAPHVPLRERYADEDEFVASWEGQNLTEGILIEHLGRLTDIMESDFFHYTLPTRLRPHTIILPEATRLCPFIDIVFDVHPDLLFAPEDFHLEHPTKLIIQACSDHLRRRRRGDLLMSAAEAEDLADHARFEDIYESLQRFKIQDHIVLAGFPRNVLQAFRSYLEEPRTGGAREEIWAWRTSRSQKLWSLDQFGTIDAVRADRDDVAMKIERLQKQNRRLKARIRELRRSQGSASVSDSDSE